MQNLSENGALLPPVVLGSMLVAVCGQTLQTLTQAFTVLHLELLHGKDGLYTTYACLPLLPRSAICLPHRYLARVPPAGRWSLPLRFCS